MSSPRSVGVAVLVLMAAAGCRHRPKYATVYSADAVRVSSPWEPDKSCVDRLLFRSRYTGYIEQTVDKEAQFFRVLARNREFHAEYDKKGRQLPLRLAPGQSPALVEFYNVQCMGPEEALVTPMNARGPLVNTEFVMDTLQRNELEAYARAIGVVGHPPSPPPARVP